MALNLDECPKMWCNRCESETPHHPESPKRCILCRRATSKKSRRKHIEKRRAESREYSRAHTEENSLRHKAYRASDPERTKARDRQNYERRRDTQIAYALQWAADNPERALENKRSASRRRKARKRNNYTEPYRDETIFERDGWMCHLCEMWIDSTLPRNDKAGATIDHLVAIVDGGADSPDNVASAHWICNVWRVDKPISVAKSIIQSRMPELLSYLNKDEAA